MPTQCWSRAPILTPSSFTPSRARAKHNARPHKGFQAALLTRWVGASQEILHGALHMDQGFSWAGGTCGMHSLVPGALALGAQEHVSVAPVPSGTVAHALSLLIPLTLICSLRFLQGLQRSGAETGEQSRKKLASEARAFVQK